MNSIPPVLLSYYALSNGKDTMVMGQLTVSSLQDYSFMAFNRRKTFRTLLRLYRTQLFANEDIVLRYNNASCTTRPDTSGAFFFQTQQLTTESQLSEVRLSTGL